MQCALNWCCGCIHQTDFFRPLFNSRLYNPSIGRLICLSVVFSVSFSWRYKSQALSRSVHPSIGWSVGHKVICQGFQLQPSSPRLRAFTGVFLFIFFFFCSTVLLKFLVSLFHHCACLVLTRTRFGQLCIRPCLWLSFFSTRPFLVADTQL